MKFPPLHPEAWDELHLAIQYYAANAGFSVASHFEQIFYNSLKMIQAAPLMHRQRENGVRRMNLSSPFGEWYIAYLLDTDVPFVVALGHAKRIPNYFQERIRNAGSPDFLQPPGTGQ